jgi:Tfp pilus assembly protein FimT
MLICIGIIAILSTVAVPAFNIWMTKTRLKVAARDVYSVLQYGRSSAVKRNTDIAVLFDTANESYMIYEDNGAGGGTAGDGTQNGTEATLKTGSLEKGVDMYQTTFNVKANQSYFNNRGLAENGWGYVYLKTSNDEYKRVMVSTTGMIKIESSSDGSTWS